MNDPDGLAPIPKTSSPPRAAPRRPGPRRGLRPLGRGRAVAAATLWAYLPTFRSLWATWGSDPNYSHGYLVLPVAALVAWRRSGARGRGPGGARPGAGPCWSPRLGRGSTSSRRRSPGWRASRCCRRSPAWCWPTAAGRCCGGTGPSVAFLRVPLPAAPEVQRHPGDAAAGLATMATCRVLRGLGQWVLEEGNVIIVGAERLEVATACSGLAMLMSLSSPWSRPCCCCPCPTSSGRPCWSASCRSPWLAT